MHHRVRVPAGSAPRDPEGAEEVARTSQRFVSAVGGALAHPRVIGALMVIGGTTEVLAGAALLALPDPTGLTKGAGLVLLGHGTDTAVSGMQGFGSGEDTPTHSRRIFTGTALALGASKETAQQIGAYGDMAVKPINQRSRVLRR